MLFPTFLGLFVLALALAWAKGVSDAPPRGRFARQVEWSLLPERTAPRVRQRALALARSVGLL